MKSIFGILKIQNCHFLLFLKLWIVILINYSNLLKKQVLCFENPKNWFHIKSDWQKNLEISTLSSTIPTSVKEAPGRCYFCPKTVSTYLFRFPRHRCFVQNCLEPFKQAGGTIMTPNFLTQALFSQCCQLEQTLQKRKCKL